jgi:hypothetical protein
MYLHPGDRNWTHLTARLVRHTDLETLSQLIPCQSAVSVIAKLSPDNRRGDEAIPYRATATTGGSKPRLYCHRSTQYIVHLYRRRHSCQRGMNTIALLCLLC